MCTPVDSECTLATTSFSEQVVLAWKDACNKAKGGCLRRRRGGGRLLSRAVMVFDALLRILRTLIVVFLRIYHMYRKKVNEHRPVRYYNIPLSPVTEKRLLSLRRKVMVLDLDETLIHSHHDGNYTPSATSSRPDFVVRVSIEGHPVRFFVYKRPHVDFFLSMVCQWYELVIFTASMQKYGMEVANHLDDNRGILTTRYFRQNCTVDVHGYTKDLTMVHEDLSSIFILDNSPSAYRGNRANAIPIKSWFSDPSDEALLDLLPFLDALRFTHDVRTVLSRNLQQHNAW